MKVYETSAIRNIALVGHQGSGKTSVAEAMLFATGAISRLGSVLEHSTVSDYHESEHKREMSIFATKMHAEYKSHKVNLLDTPGYPDFVGEVSASLHVADACLFVLNATDPVQVGTEVTWGYADKRGTPSLFLVNHVDRNGIDFPQIVAKLQERFSRSATVLQIPVGDGSRAIIDILQMKQLTFPEGNDAPTVEDINAGFADLAAEYRNALVENVAENDEALMEEYLEEGELTDEQLIAGLKDAVRQRLIFPIMVSSATQNIGISRMLGILIDACPSPAEAAPSKTETGDDIVCDASGESLAFVFRIMSEQHVGEYAFLKICSGTLEAGSDIENAHTDTTERLGGFFILNGKSRENVPKVVAGDICAVVKLKNTHTNNTLRAKNSNVILEPVAFPHVRYSAAIRAVNAGEEDKLSSGLHKLVEEDPSLVIRHDTDLHQLLLGGLGEMQLEIAKFRLQHRFGVEVELSIPKVSYRETVQKSARSSYRHKKQTGGAGQFADISMVVEPLEGEYQAPADIKVRSTSTVETAWGAKIEFIDGIVGGIIDMRRFSGAIQKGIVEAMGAGAVAGYPCGDVRIVIYDGKMHSVDSNEAAFKSASRQCFRKGFEQARPALLEPVFDLEVLLPDEFMGDVMSDLNTRRARIQGMEAESGNQKILAQVPEAELLRYSTQLRSLTQGRGVHAAKFNRYEPVPKHVQEQIAASAVPKDEPSQSRR